MYLSMLSPRGGGGGGTPGICEAFYLYCLPTLGNLTKNLGPRVGTFAFICAGEWDQRTLSQVLVCMPANVELK